MHIGYCILVDMDITKLEHACLDIQKGTTRLIIDPGVFSASLTNFTNIDAVVITHVHPDHFDPDKIAQIITENPNLKIFTTQEVSEQINNPCVTVPEREQPVQIGDISLEFFGTDHAVIDPSYPLAQNIGVLIDNTLYYPGDSFTMCPKPYDILAVPIHAPWLKFSETADFIRKSSAQKIFPTHNGFVNEDGHALYARLLTNVCNETKKELVQLLPGQTLQV